MNKPGPANLKGGLRVIHRRHSIRRFTSLSGIVAAWLLAAAFGAAAVQVHAQARGGQSEAGSPQRGGSPPGSAQRGGSPQGGVIHARRDVVRTREPLPAPRYIPPPSSRTAAPRNPSNPTSTGQPPVATGRRPVVATSAR